MREDWIVGLFLLGLVAAFAIAPCVVMVWAWNKLPAGQAWVVTGSVLAVDALAVWRFVKAGVLDSGNPTKEKP